MLLELRTPRARQAQDVHLAFTYPPIGHLVGTVRQRALSYLSGERHFERATKLLCCAFSHLAAAGKALAVLGKIN